MSNDKFEIRIIKDSDGTDTKLSAMSIKESNAFFRLLGAMNKIAESFEDDTVTVNVREGSAAIATQGAPVSNLLSIFYDVRDNKSSNTKLVEGLREIQTVFIQNGLKFDAIVHSGITSLDLYSDFVNNKSFRIKTEKRDSSAELVFISGKLLEVGGVRPNFHIIPLKGKKIKIECTESDATRVNTNLYKNIYLSAWRYKRPGYSVIYKFCDYYKEKENYDLFKQIITAEMDHMEYVGIINDSLKDILRKGDLMLARAFVKLFNHDSVDNGILKMILILTKYFQDNSNLMDVRKSIKSILEKKRNAPLI